MNQPRLQRRYQLQDPLPLVVEIHEPSCRCFECESMATAAEATTPVLDAFCRAGWLAGAGFVIGSAIAFAIDARGAAHALVAALTWSVR